MPEDVIKRANEILEQLEGGEEKKENSSMKVKESAVTNEEYTVHNKKDNSNEQISFGILEKETILKEILSLNIVGMTPIDAMNALYNLQNKAKLIGDDVN